MLLKLLALFTIVPLIELALLIPLGMHIGLWPTIGLVVGTAVLGAVLGKLEGARAWSSIKQELNQGKIPGDSILDGLAVLIAGAFMVTPGVLTDIAAIILLIPPARAPLRAYARKRFKKMVQSGEVNVVSSGSFSFGSTTTKTDTAGNHQARPYQRSPFEAQDDVIDVTPDGDEASGEDEPARSEQQEQIKG